MAEVTTVKLADRHVPQKDCGEVFGMSIDYAISATEAVNGDNITLLEFQRDGVIFGGQVHVDGSLGAAATIRLRHNDGSAQTNLSAATTAAGADTEQLTSAMRFSAGDTLELLVGGGDIGAAANVKVDLMVSHNPVINAAPLTA